MSTDIDYTYVSDVSDIEVGHSISVNVKGKKILICNTEEGFFAVQDINLITKVRMTHCLEHLEIKYLHIFAISF